MQVGRFIERLERHDSSDSDEDFRRERIIQPHPNYFDVLDEIDFFRHFRISKRKALQALHYIEEMLEFETKVFLADENHLS